MDTNALSTLSFSYLAHLWKKGLRNGNWRKLNRVEKALYMASLSLARIRYRLVNPRLILELQYIIDKLRETMGDRLMMTAYQRAIELYNRFTKNNLFEWAPQARSWFSDPSYVIWIGNFSETQ